MNSNDDHPQEPPEEGVLDIDLELEPEDLPPVPSPLAGGADMLVIDAEHLAEVPLPPAKGATGGGKAGAGDGLPPARPVGEAPRIRSMGPPDVRAIISLLLAGAIGGFIGWALAEPFISDRPAGSTPETQLLIKLLATNGLLFAVWGGLIGTALGAVEGINSRSLEKACWGALLGLGIGGAGGFLGGVFGEALYAGLQGGENKLDASAQVLVRGVGWALVGIFVGLGQGAWTKAKPKMINGMIGGFIGGLAGGLMFDPLHAIVAFIMRLPGGTVGGEISRMVSVTVLGAACGAAIGLVEQMRREAWLRIVDGPLRGKQFIIYRSPTVIGSSPKCDITLAMDKGVAPQHLSISQLGARYVLADLGSPTGTQVNGQLAATRTLRSGDRIAVGQTTMQYAERAVRGEG